MSGYTADDIIRVVSQFIEKRMSMNREALNKKEVITDGETDITNNLRGRQAAYAAVKYFIDCGLREVAG